ncbi:ABC transporter ATP-binding protein [Zoogloea dura]|jgi:putative ABC transport system ATP-binding protein|uniref:ATP-binding cassette domain-containing protein n=1 Tax=Zoogloea dura TaxID=2728840 RepID=A0A848FZS7_9RHOO|nr:ATP-binding cassette domain-containing protein [Zoogloea dura]NML24522.1 ATP-binding cassette domain-containing protein [Zoogloea dura]
MAISPAPLPADRSSVAPYHPATETAVLIRNLRFCWPGCLVPAVNLRSLELAAGEHLFLHGESGAGKTTLLNLIGGLLLAQAGELQLFGQSLTHLPTSTRDALRADRLGFVFQQFNLLPYLSVLDNVLLASRFSASRHARCIPTPRSEAQRLLDTLELPPSLAARRACELSVGQQQRVAAARALLGRPSLILADEPTSSLDARNAAQLFRLLLDEAGRCGAAVILVSHDPGLAAGFTHHLKLPSA